MTDEHTSAMVWMWTINELYRKVVLGEPATISELSLNQKIALLAETPIAL